eukprot:scaffold2047_cov129-Cylindrotheca_fusiformis.AAC.9
MAILFCHRMILKGLLFLLSIGIQAGGVAGLSSSKDYAPLFLPTDPENMVKLASVAVQRAFSEGDIHRQTLRLALSESMYSGKEESFVADRAIGWQGGPAETYRYLSPMASTLLRQVSAGSDDNTSGLTPKIQEQVLLDFDGSSLLNAQSPMGALNDSLAILQPNTDTYYMDLIRELEDEFSDTPGKAKRLLLLVNPAWRDASSWGFLQSNKAQKQILDRYETTFALDQFIMRGQKISLLKAWPTDWSVYWTPLEGKRKTVEAPRLLGTFVDRPEYTELERLLAKAQ